MSDMPWDDGQLLQDTTTLAFYRYGPHFYGKEDGYRPVTYMEFVSTMQERNGPGWQPKGRNLEG